ncbi:hypothetical protein BH11PAT1_BH11PAT1_1900 [soil metagenome]
MSEVSEGLQLSSIDKNPIKENLKVERATQALKRLQEKARVTDTEKKFPLVGLLGDTNIVEGHQIDFVQQSDRTVMHFKMTTGHKQAVLDRLQQQESLDPRITSGTYEFQFVNGKTVGLADCWKIAIDENTTVSISKNSTTIVDEDYYSGDPIKNEEGQIIGFTPSKPRISKMTVASLDGAVKIDVVGVTDPDKIAEKLSIASELLNIPSVFSEPSVESDMAYKEARVRWQHKLVTDEQYAAYAREVEEGSGLPLLEHLRREEVSPEYFTVVDPGASERYQQSQPFYLVHQILNNKFLPSLVTNGFLASHERYKRGMEYNGRSTDIDFRTGGGDSVFTRMYPTDTQENIFGVGYQILIDPVILDRTDWFLYKRDGFGTTEGKRFTDRPSPEEFFSQMKKNFDWNEVMIRRAIPPKYILGVAVPSAELKQQALAELTSNGIDSLNGKRIEDCIFVGKNFQDSQVS